MSEQYRLAYSGEVLDGQHPAVVKKRLAAVLKLDDERMDVLFSGKQVIVKRATDEKTAARYQEVFNKAGARLHVLPLEEAPVGDSKQDKAVQRQAPRDTQAQPDESTQSSDGPLSVLPAGSEVLTQTEREPEAEADIDTSHLSVQGATFTVPEAAPEASGPNVDHITVAEAGADLGVASEEVVVEVDADFDLAEVGAILRELEEQPKPTVDVDNIDFEVAAPGADLGTSTHDPAPPAPDTSHLSLEQDTARQDTTKKDTSKKDQ